MFVVVNKHSTARVTICWFIIYYRLVMHGNSNINFLFSFILRHISVYSYCHIFHYEYFLFFLFLIIISLLFALSSLPAFTPWFYNTVTSSRLHTGMGVYVYHSSVFPMPKALHIEYCKCAHNLWCLCIILSRIWATWVKVINIFFMLFSRNRHLL